jgi:hypothetical protein
VLSEDPSPAQLREFPWVYDPTSPDMKIDNRIRIFALCSARKEPVKAGEFSIFTTEGKWRDGCVLFATAVTRG